MKSGFTFTYVCTPFRNNSKKKPLVKSLARNCKQLFPKIWWHISQEEKITIAAVVILTSKCGYCFFDLDASLPFITLWFGCA